jgi:hypothetical protein
VQGKGSGGRYIKIYIKFGDLYSAYPALPSAYPALPSAYPALPSAYPALPSAYPTLPSAYPALPSALHTKSSVCYSGNTADSQLQWALTYCYLSQSTANQNKKSIQCHGRGSNLRPLACKRIALTAGPCPTRRILSHINRQTLATRNSK